MRPLRLSLAVLGATVGLTLGLAAAMPLLAHAPKLAKSHPLLSEINNAASLASLYSLRQRLSEQLRSASDSGPLEQISSGDPYLVLSQLAQRVRHRINGEEQAKANYQRALELGRQAVATRNQVESDTDEGSGTDTLRLLRQQEFLWQSAIELLESIPEDSLQATTAADKAAEYQRNLDFIAQKVDQADSAFLAEIAADTGRPQAVRISLCHLSGECRDYKGNVPPASPASLIKLPMAVALMQKVTTENIDLDEQVYIDPHNWTENATGAKIYVDHEYSLREVMVRMIKESNNIATNQLVDYMGWEFINTTLAEMGYPTTQVHTKLVGDSTFPTKNRGFAPNVTTANDLTEMMRQVYVFQNPGDEEILDALVGQYDWDFGYKALKGLDRRRVSWIGEKTGQNSKVIGSTLAVKVDDQRYVLTVTLDNSANQRMLREVIQAVVKHILDSGHLVPVGRQVGADVQG